jgi:hypothetical protein
MAGTQQLPKCDISNTFFGHNLGTQPLAGVMAVENWQKGKTVITRSVFLVSQNGLVR